MLIVGIILCVLAIILCVKTSDSYNHEGICVISGTGAIIIGFLDVLVCFFIIAYFTSGIVAKDKIKMYQEENTKIEEQINVLVKQYMEFEKETLTEFKSESSMTLVSLFPELKSDELVQKQMSIYIENNKKIKELKESLIDIKIGKWLLYFGK